MFEKKNVDRLPERRLYDCPIDLQEGAHPPFGPIYELAELELEALREYIDENIRKGSSNPPNHQPAPQSYFSRRRMGSYDYAWIIGASVELPYIISIPYP